MDINFFLALSLGLAVGLTLALTGAGGAILGVPLLVFGLGIPVSEASPIALLAVAIAACFGAALGFRAGILRYKAALVMSAFGLLLSPLGLWVAQQIPNQPLLILFAVILIYVSITMFRQAQRELNGSPANEAQNQPCLLDQTRGKLIWTLPCFRAMVAAGSTAGFLSGLLGVGGGFVIVPVLKKTTNLPIKSIVATSLGVITLISLTGVIGSSIIGTMNWSTAIPFALGTLIGMLSGKSIGNHIKGPRLQQGFALVAFCVSLGMAYRAFA